MPNIFNDGQTQHLNSQRAYGWDRTVNTDLAAGTRMVPNSPTQNGLLQTSTNIRIKMNGDVIGMVQSLAVSESRNINKLQAVGQEGVVQAVPSNTNGGQLTVSRIALYDRKMIDVTGINNNDIGVFVTLRQQRVPFEISCETPSNAGEDTVFGDITTYYDCWISSYSKSYSVQSITVAENLTIQYSDLL
ncbi:virion structural protein [Bacillus phage G]|uniref:Gp180 n=1 Tax=Bacillus phage G TaxID=2884420 RepID=G3MBP6_9CAUD|nr:virion structural protein [Bacillus phage G]AEO93440.1 gp180 [Bacillus phage G]